MTDPINGAPPLAAVQLEPAKINADVYLLDLLLGVIAAFAGQLRFRGNIALAEKLENLAVLTGPGQAMLLRAFKDQLHTETYGKTAAGLVLAGPGDLPRV